MRHEEEKIAGNTRGKGEKQGRACIRAGYFKPALAVQSLLKSADGAGLHRADIAQQAQVAVAALQASAQVEGCLDMNTTYTVKTYIERSDPFLTTTGQVFTPEK
jgi:hypothetical protein